MATRIEAWCLTCKRRMPLIEVFDFDETQLLLHHPYQAPLVVFKGCGCGGTIVEDIATRSRALQEWLGEA